ncbi:MAG: rod shape-determining protein MreC [Eubacteriales bacterium]|nr:rod shape-determining protein MreC [Eubacteriales bacterium]
MKWIKTHKLITFLIVVVLVTFIFLMTAIATGGQGNFITRLLNTGVSATTEPLVKAARGISDNVTGIFSYKELQEENRALKEENNQLKQKVTDSALSANQLEELKNLTKALNYKGIKSSKDIVSGDVISMDGTNWMNLFTINVGTESGVKIGNVVTCGEGLIGRVIDTGSGWSKVVAVIDEANKVSFKISRNLKQIGIVSGSSDGKLKGYMLDASANIAEGDVIITSGMGMYPEGIEIGKISKIKYDSDTQLKTIEVKSSVNFKTLQKVVVIL